MISPKKKLLLVHSSNDLYGASKIFLQLIDLLTKNGFDIHVILPEQGMLDNFLIKKNIKIVYVELGVLRKKYLNPLGLINRAVANIKAIAFLSKYIKDHSIDLVYTNTSTVICGGIAAKKNGVPSLFHIHEIPTGNKLYEFLSGKIINCYSSKVLTVSNSVKSHWLKNINEHKIERVYNGIEYKKIDSIIKLHNEKKPIRALRSLTSFLLAVAMIGQSITTGKSTMNKLVIGPYIRESNFAAEWGFGVPSQDISLFSNLRKIFFQTSVTNAQAITTGLLTDVTGKGTSIVGFLITVYAIILSLWVSSIGRGEFGESKGNFVLVQMTRLIHFFTRMVIKELIPSMIKASGERRAAETKRTAFVTEYTTKAANYIGKSLLESMLPTAVSAVSSSFPLLTQ